MANKVDVSGGAYTATMTVTPTAAAYSANDVMGVAQAMSWVDADGDAFPGGELLITSSLFEVAHTAVISGETSYNLHLYNVTPPSAHADNDAWDLPSGDRTAHISQLSLGTPVDIISTLRVEQDIINKQITVAANTGKTWAELVTVGGFTATAAARRVVLHAIAL